MRYSFLFRLALSACILAFLYICLMMFVVYQSGLSLMNLDVQFVLPNDYRGLFVLRFAENEQEIANAQEFILTDERKYSLTIPSDGVVIINNMNILREFHGLNAIYQDGSKLEVESGFDKIDDADIKLRPSRTMGDGSTWYLVGTQHDMEWLYRHSEQFIPGPVTAGAILQFIFIVPDDYEGYFRIIEMTEEDTDESLIKHEDSVWKIYVPLSGIIRTSQRIPFRADHIISLQYTSGENPVGRAATLTIVSNEPTDQLFPVDRSDPRVWEFHVGRLRGSITHSETTPGLSLPKDK